MRCIEAICDQGQLLVDIFVNYDCDLEGANLFERLISALVRIAQGSQDKEAQAALGPEEAVLRLTVSNSSLTQFKFEFKFEGRPAWPLPRLAQVKV